MENLPEKCPNCGAETELFNENTYECSFCGSKFSSPKKNEAVGVELAKTNKKPINQLFETAFANAENAAFDYFSKGPKAVKYGKGPFGVVKGYDAVLKYYADAEIADKTQSKYYISLSRFHNHANLEGFQNRTRFLKTRAHFIDTYIFIIDSAIKYADEADKANLEDEKKETIKILNVELSKYHEYK